DRIFQLTGVESARCIEMASGTARRTSGRCKAGATDCLATHGPVRSGSRCLRLPRTRFSGKRARAHQEHYALTPAARIEVGGANKGTWTVGAASCESARRG